jgi:archaemetzincin
MTLDVLAGMLLSMLVTPSSRSQRTIAVAAVGSVRRSEIEPLLTALQDSFGTPVVIAAEIALPPSSYDASRRQYLSTAILDSLAAAKKPEWDRLLGVADVDLYVPDLNFVFGEGDGRRGVAVFSLARLKADDDALFRRRAATEAIHELGHSYGLGHCDDPHCVLWFSNTLAESDRKGTRFCEKHRRELESAMSRR